MRLAETHAAETHAASAGAGEIASTRAAFFVSGLAMAAWAPLVPYAKARLGVDDGTLGLLLLCLGGGSLMAMPLAGMLTARLGCRRVILAAAAVIACALPVLTVGADVAVVAAALMVFGAGLGTIDVAMNIQAVLVERASGRAIMSGFHGLFSLGGITGAGGTAAILWGGAPPLAAALAVMAIMAALMLRFGGRLLRHGTGSAGPAFALPRGPVLAIGILCFICFLTEGAMLDWSAVFLTDVRGVAAAQAGIAFALFSVAMTAGRFLGDRLVQAAGPTLVLCGGGLCAACGLTLAVLSPWPAAALAGFVLVGAGCSNVAPLLFSAAGRQRSMPEHLSVAAVTTLGYAGVLAGPAGIGLVADHVGLGTALLGVAGLLTLMAAASPAVMRVTRGAERA